nr:XRE family transcriptional regulator [Maliibacterium massiliense]
MNVRRLPLGTRNVIGARITQARMERAMPQKMLLIAMQNQGVDISWSSLSQLEGQRRPVADFEIVALATALNVSVPWLLGLE